MEAAGFEQYFETVLKPSMPWLPDWVGSVDWIAVLWVFVGAAFAAAIAIMAWYMKRRKRAIENPDSDPYGMFVQRVNVQNGDKHE